MVEAFIRAYGLHWDREEITWTRNGELLGRQKARVDALRLANFWDQTGIYILHDAYGAYYAGQAAKQPLGERLRQHTADDHFDKWERFSWFGFNAILPGRTKDGLYRIKKTRPRDLLGSTSRSIHDIEALLIMSLGTHRSGNKQTEKFTNAEPWEQVWGFEAKKYLDIAARQAEEGVGPMFQ